VKTDSSTVVSDHSFTGLIGVARCDVTPPVGVYNRIWGAARHDRAEGVHRPITATALAIRRGPQEPPLLLISLDWAVLTRHSAQVLMPSLVALVGGDAGRVIVSCSHTHSVALGFLGPDRYSMPGGDLILPSMEATRDKLSGIARQAITSSVQTRATITWATGRCAVATNRDFPDPDPSKDRFVCGFSPPNEADDTVVVARITRDSDDVVIATLVNYACHPTTLGWDCRLLSPDYIGAMREVVESRTGGAPCLFFQGASGELAPARQYIGDIAIADRYGRQLGYAALSAIESMLPPRHRLAYEGAIESGAPLARWGLSAYSPSAELCSEYFDVSLPLVPMPPLVQLEADLAGCADRVLAERIRRKMNIVKTLGTASESPQPAWVWRLGDGVICAQPNEPYSVIQQRLRAEFPRQAILFLSVSGVSFGYLYPKELAGLDIYQVWQTPFAPGSLELLHSEFERVIRSVTGA
jgi:hypothetical protein